ncbi:hypothetical protein [Streptomyces sp. NPDC002078]
MNLTSAAAALDERSRVLMCEVRSDGRSEPSMPVVFQDLVHELAALDREYGVRLIRPVAWSPSRPCGNGRGLHELFRAVQRCR